MKRREFLGVLGGAAAALPFAARAQQPGSVRRIGLLSSTSAQPYRAFVDAIVHGLAERDIILGRNVTIEQRWADGHYERLPALASELIALRPDVIVAIAPPAARAAKAATTNIPVVFTTAGDPVSLGLVSSLNRPGGNLTGVHLVNFETITKRIELLTKLVTNAHAIGILVNPNNPSTPPTTASARAAAKTFGKALVVTSAGSAREIDAALTTFVEQKVEAISVEADPFLSARREQIVRRAAQHSLPAIYSHREFTLDGGLMSYGTNLSEGYRQIGRYTARILKGEKPEDLPVVQLNKFELVINLKTAKSLGLVVPNWLQILADEVIE